MAELSLKFEFKVSVDSSIKNEIFALLFNETNDSIFLQIFLRKSYCRLICRSNFFIFEYMYTRETWSSSRWIKSCYDSIIVHVFSASIMEI